MPARLPPHVLPGWPRLMRADMAAAYLGMGSGTLSSLEIPRVKAKSIMLYDRYTLDEFANSLSRRIIESDDELVGRLG